MEDRPYRGALPLFTMNQKTLKKINGRLRSAFGENPHGDPNYMWCEAKNLVYLYETEGYKEQRTESGLIVMRPVWERHDYADRYGDVWMLTKWQKPELSYTDWYYNFGGALPFPARGMYHPIESTVLPAGAEPDEDLNQYSIYKLCEHLGLSYGDHLMDIKEMANKVEREDRDTWSDIVDDAVPAFANIPGSKEHVSFPNVGRH